MGNLIKFKDTVEFTQVTQDKEPGKLADFSNMQQSAGGPLIVKIAATHAGIITRNNGFYLPDKMRKGVGTFTEHYPKPVQVHHNQDADPIGRIIKAEYVDTSATMKDQLAAKDAFRKNPRGFEDFLSGKLSFIQSINFICDSLAATEVLTDPAYQGLGYAKLTAAITDPDAAQKIKDGRFLTGSVGVTTNKAVCSVCKEDWTGEEGPCAHRPGKMYDGVKAFLITGDLVYDEYSMVNVPADRHSRIIEVSHNGITDSIELDETSTSQKTDISVYQLSDSVDLNKLTSTINGAQEDSMELTEQVKTLLASLKDKYKDYTDEAVLKEVETLLASNPGKLIEDELAIAAEVQLDKVAITKIFALAERAKQLESLKVIRPFLDTASLELIFTAGPKDAEAFYTALNELEWNDYAESEDEEINKYTVEHPEDNKLSASARKRLPGSSFCGPNRSFPVPDCVHAATARKLVNRASASPVTKAKILANISRKESAMGCGLPSKVEEPITPQNDSCTKCSEIAKQLEAVKDELATVKTSLTGAIEARDKLMKDSEEKDKLVKDLEAARAELKLAHEDLTQIADQLVTAKEQSTKVLAERVLDYKLLSGTKVEDQTKEINDLLALGEDKIQDQFTSLTAKVDMKKITDSINSGLARQPHGTVEDPTGSLEANQKIFDKAKMKQIETEYYRIALGGRSAYGFGPEAAERYRKDMQKQGHMPASG